MTHENAFSSASQIVPITFPVGLTNRFPPNVRTGTDTLETTAGFSSINATITSSTDFYYSIEHSLKAVSSPPVNAFFSLVSQYATEIPVTVGTNYTFQYRAYTPVSTKFRASIYWLNSAGVPVGSPSTAEVTVSATTWTLVSIAANAPATTATARLTVWWEIKNTSTNPDLYIPAPAYFDAFSFYATATPTTNFLTNDQRTGTGISGTTEWFNPDNCTLTSVLSTVDDPQPHYLPEPTLSPSNPALEPNKEPRSLRADVTFSSGIETYELFSYNGVPVVPGETYATAFKVLSEEEVNITSRLNWYSSSGEFIGYEEQQDTFSSGVWSQAQVSGLAPTGAAFGRLSATWSDELTSEASLTFSTIPKYFDEFVFWSVTETFDNVLSGNQKTFDSPLEYSIVEGSAYSSIAKALSGPGEADEDFMLESSPALKLTVTGTGPVVVASSVSFPQVVPGRTYTATAKVFETGDRDLEIRIAWLTSPNLSSVIGTTITSYDAGTASGEWRAVSVSGVAPAAATHASIFIKTSGTVAPSYLSEFGFWEGPANSNLLNIPAGSGSPASYFSTLTGISLIWSEESDPQHTGETNLKVLPLGTSESSFYTKNLFSPKYPSVYKETQYSASVSVTSTYISETFEGQTLVRISLLWLNSSGTVDFSPGGNVIGRSDSNYIKVSVDSWDTIEVSGIAPDGAKYASLYIELSGIPNVVDSGYFLHFDDFALWEGPLYQFNQEFSSEFWISGTPSNTSIPYVTCIPNVSQPYGVHQLVATNLPGNKIIKIVRRNIKDNTEYVIRASADIEFNGNDNSILIFDPEAPIDQEFIYTITVEFTGTDEPPVPTTYQDFSTPVPCSYPALHIYTGDINCVPVLISDPLVVGFGEWVGLLGIDALSHPSRQELLDVIGQPWPVAISGIRSTPRTTMRLLTRSLEGRARLLSVLQSGRVLLLRNPDPSFPENNWYIAVGSVSEERIFSDHRRPERRWVVEIAQVSRPSGYLTFSGRGRTYATLLNYLPDGETPAPENYTYADLLVLYKNYLDVALGGGLAVSPLGDVVALGSPTFPTIEAAEASWSLS